MLRTTEQAMKMAEHRKAIGRVGGRPKGSLSPQTIKKIKDKQTLEAAARARAGRVLNNLLLSSDAGDTQASKEIFDRAFGKPEQGIKAVVEHTFSLRELAEQRSKMLDGNADLIVIEEVPRLETSTILSTEEDK